MAPVSVGGRLYPSAEPVAEGDGSREAVGGMEVVVRHLRDGRPADHRAFYDTVRPGANEWVLFAGDVTGPDDELTGLVERVSSAIAADACTHSPPSTVLASVHRLLKTAGGELKRPFGTTLIVARFELDSCGAWVTFAGAGHPKPMILRQSGWVDIRAHHSPSLDGSEPTLADDRLGIGPGDALVLCTEAIGGSRDLEESRFGAAVLPDVIVDAAGRPAEEVSQCVVEAATTFGSVRPSSEGFVIVLRVPEAVRHEGASWVVRSTGIPADELRLPGYSMRCEHDELPAQPAAPPREALARITPEPPSIPALRRLLRRLFRSWHIGIVAEDDIELLTTEVATNVFAQSASPVTLIVRYTGRVVRVEVGDGEREAFRKRRRTFDELRGHRLALVESLASDWGVSTTSAGTRMWFEVPTANRGEPS